MIREEELKRKQIHDSKDKPSRTENKDFQIPSADNNIHSVSEIDLPDIDELILGLNQEDEQTTNQTSTSSSHFAKKNKKNLTFSRSP